MEFVIVMVIHLSGDCDGACDRDCGGNINRYGDRDRDCDVDGDGDLDCDRDGANCDRGGDGDCDYDCDRGGDRICDDDCDDGDCDGDHDGGRAWLWFRNVQNNWICWR